MALHALAGAMDRLSIDCLNAALGAFRAADAMAGARATLREVAVRTDQTVGMNAVDAAAARIAMAAFTRKDQTVGMNSVELAIARAYQKIYGATPGLNLPGYGFQTRRETQYWLDLFSLAPFAGRRA